MVSQVALTLFGLGLDILGFALLVIEWCKGYAASLRADREVERLIERALALEAKSLHLARGGEVEGRGDLRLAFMGNA